MHVNPIRFISILTIALCFTTTSRAQEINPSLLQQPWKAQWICPVKTDQWSASSNPKLQQYGVYKYRKAFTLDRVPEAFVVHVSADNRFKLFVNGKQVASGPARSDLYFWNFETIDLAPHLTPGKNTIAALVWNEGPHRPMAQISLFTAFILQGNTDAESVVNTDETWKVIEDTSYSPLRVRSTGYYVAGPGELVDMNNHIKNWTAIDFDDSAWSAANPIGPGLTKDAAIDSREWMLVPSPLPQMEMTPTRLRVVRQAEGVKIPNGFPATRVAVTIPPRTHATILLDQTYNTNAYPTIVFSRGKGGSVSMAYTEALYARTNEDISGNWIPRMPKGNRNIVEGKTFIGRRDSIISDGSQLQAYTPLAYRTFRYIQLRIHTADEPLIIEDLYCTFTGYPFKMNAHIETDNGDIHKMLDIGWRTARLCAVDTYMDCPYYEQLQYVGDTRIQALVSLYNSGDDRLVRNALTLMDRSRIAEGITLSRYPSYLDQQIPTFSLWWIAMLHDYWRYGNDEAFVRDMLPGMRSVLAFFERYQRDDGSLQNVPYWLFTDWVRDVKGWERGMAPVGANGESAVLDIHLMWTLQLAAEMERHFGVSGMAKLYADNAEQIKQTIQKKYWDESRQLYADTEAKDFFSQHANALAILSGAAEGERVKTIASTLMTDTTLAPASIYFRYYLHLAWVKAGMGDDYLSWLDKWRENISMGLTTWAETSDVDRSRSDCHAWGSSPNIEFFRTVLGIDSDAPGFSAIKIEPHLGDLRDISGEIPHPKGTIAVQYSEKKKKRYATITLPPGTRGRFIWKGKESTLNEGKNEVRME